MLEVKSHIHAPVMKNVLRLHFTTLLFENLKCKGKSVNCLCYESKTPVKRDFIDRSYLHTKIIKCVDIGGVDNHILEIVDQRLAIQFLEI